MDLKYGGKFLGGIKETQFGNLGAHDTANTDYSAMPYLFDSIVQDGDVITDIGSGKGRVINYLLGKFPKCKIYGIELDPECASNLKQRLRKYRNVWILCGDACQKIPTETTVCYLFNPFNCDVMERFKASISKIVETGRRPVKIIYYNPTCADVFAHDPKFTIKKIKLPANFHQAILIESVNNPVTPHHLQRRQQNNFQVEEE
jgi:predicted RNA methylase